VAIFSGLGGLGFAKNGRDVEVLREITAEQKFLRER